MKFTQHGKKQWYTKHNNKFYHIEKLGYVYCARVMNLEGVVDKSSVQYFDTLKESKKHLQGLL